MSGTIYIICIFHVFQVVRLGSKSDMIPSQWWLGENFVFGGEGTRFGIRGLNFRLTGKNRFDSERGRFPKLFL